MHRRARSLLLEFAVAVKQNHDLLSVDVGLVLGELLDKSDEADDPDDSEVPDAPEDSDFGVPLVFFFA